MAMGAVFNPSNFVFDDETTSTLVDVSITPGGVGDGALCGLYFGDDWQTADVSFEVTHNGNDWFAVKQNGSPVKLSGVTPESYEPILPADLSGCLKVRLVSSVEQTASVKPVARW